MNKYIADFSLDNYIAEQCVSDEEFARHFRYQQFLGDISQKIYELRKEAGLTQTQLAELIDTKQPVIARLESGDDTKMPSLSTLYRIAEAVGVSVSIKFEKDLEKEEINSCDNANSQKEAIEQVQSDTYYNIFSSKGKSNAINQEAENKPFKGVRKEKQYNSRTDTWVKSDIETERYKSVR